MGAFWWGSMVHNFFIPGFSVHTVAGLVSMCFGLGAIAFAFEWIKLLQSKHKQSELKLRARQLKTICPMNNEATTLLGANSESPIDLRLQRRVLLHATDAGLWLSLQNIGYFLMLTVMLLNGWMFLSILTGSALGYFVFGQAFMKLNLQNCQVIRDTFCMSNCGEPDLNNLKDGESTPVLQQPSTSVGNLNFPSHCTTVEINNQ